jgi:hypothetical protein
MEEGKEVFKNNPFKITGIKRVSRNTKNNIQVVADKKTGELYEMYKVQDMTTLVDSRKFVKVYADSGTTIKDFSVPTLRVWCYILQHLQPNKDYIEINPKVCMEFCGYKGKSNASFYNGISELIEKNILALSTINEKYWVNSDFIYNGNRLKNYVEDIDFENE